MNIAVSRACGVLRVVGERKEIEKDGILKSIAGLSAKAKDLI